MVINRNTLIKIVLFSPIIFAISPFFSGGRGPTAQLILLLLLIMATLISVLEPRLKIIKYNNSLVLLFTLFITFISLSLIWSHDTYRTINYLILFIEAAAVFSISFKLSGFKDGKKILFLAYTSLACIFSVYGIYLYITGSYDRLTSFIGWPNPAAAYLIPAIILNFGNLSDIKINFKKLYPTLTLLSTVLILLAFWLTASRAASILLILCVMTLLIVKKLKPRVVIITLTIFIVSILLSIITSDIRQHKFHQTSAANAISRVQTTKESGVSFSDRINYLKSSFWIWEQNPVIGTGAGTFGTVHPRYQISVISASQDAHNYYAQSLSELGIVGTILILTIIFLIIRGMVNSYHKDKNILPWLISAVALLAHFGIDMDIQFPVLIFIMASITGSIYSDKKIIVGKSSPLTVLILILMAILSWQSFTSYQDNIYGQAEFDRGNYTAAADYFKMANSTLVYDSVNLDKEAQSLVYEYDKSPKNYSSNLLVSALEISKKAQKNTPDNSYNYLTEGQILERMNKLNEAVNSYQKALYYDPYGYPEYVVNLANAYINQGHYQLAINTINSLFDIYSDSVIQRRSFQPGLTKSISNAYLVRSMAETKLMNDNAAREDVIKSFQYMQF